MGITERVLFFKQLKENFIHTGSITPSSQFLVKGITSEWFSHKSPATILEVGPGTGAITREIARRMKPEDTFHICEINTLFAQHIEKIIEQDPIFLQSRNRIEIFNLPIQSLNLTDHYDFIISSLPLNNFDYRLVREILGFFQKSLKNGGILSYFEYIAIRQMKISMSNGKDRIRLIRLNNLLRQFLNKYEIKSQIIPFNIPPASIHHVKF